VSAATPRIFREVASADSAELRRLFERAGCGCHCRYWHFAGDKNGWLDRLAHAPELSAQELSDDLHTPALAPHGVVAMDGEQVTGWLKLTRAGRVQKLYGQRPYRGLPCFDDVARGDVLTVGCLLVDPEVRRQGIARGLLAAALEVGRRVGARALEAFPRRAPLLGDAELWMGPFEIYEELGFRPLHVVGQYSVLRKDL
jgi:GNAT superfamily N-acetyltransferase